jgi:hypothetical protein
MIGFLASCGISIRPAADAAAAGSEEIEFGGNETDGSIETLPAASDGEGGVDESARNECLGGQTNAIAVSIAEKYPEVSYDQVMTWFCDGAEFEDILLALLTARLSDAETEDLLEDISMGITWDQIWEELNLTDVIDQ